MSKIEKLIRLPNVTGSPSAILDNDEYTRVAVNDTITIFRDRWQRAHLPVSALEKQSEYTRNWLYTNIEFGKTGSSKAASFAIESFYTASELWDRPELKGKRAEEH